MSSSKVLKFEVYEKSQSELLAFKSRLPEDVVSSLAREVLERVAARSASISGNLDMPTQSQIDSLCRALISDDPAAGADAIAGLRDEEVSVEVVYLKYLAAAARTLGTWWDTDRVSFAQVTVGTARMYGIMRAMKDVLEPPPNLRLKSAIFASVPGEDHTLGVRMAADLFRRNNWYIELLLDRTHDELVAQIDRVKCRVLGLSLAGAHGITALSQLVVALRISSPATLILVSGPSVNEVEDVIRLMGVDAIADNFPSAQREMERLWEAAVQAEDDPRS